MAPWDVTPSQVRALRTLYHHGPMRPGELARHLRIAARSATGVVDDLEQRQLVARRPDPADRRAVLVSPSDRASELLQQIRAARIDEADRFFGSLSDTDRAELARILRLLAQE